ncbi:hypothetical protein SLS56_006078 [Neofusicoccum ribis]|uniref:DUF1857-domain-containing protein n=1 Tax=Neofusicoccum ribis TaxID=45134 RepID=A0ABR3SRQ9_9PEZI
MVTINIAFTAPINPPSATPPLTVPQLWAGLQRKIRHAQEFVPAITACTVVSETTEGGSADAIPVVTREAVFAEGGRVVTEVCRSYAPSRVDFHQPDGSVVSNIVSEAADGALHMTYSFSWRRPEVAAGSAEEEALRAKYRAMARMAVGKSIESIREMVKDGRIQ